MPSRAAHLAALRRSKEPSVIPPEGVTLPELPRGWTWLNPVRGYDFARDEWLPIRAVSGGSETGPVVRRQGGVYTLTLKTTGTVAPAQPMDCLEAFNAAAAWVHGIDASAPIQDLGTAN